MENKDEKISNLFSDEIVKTDSQKFFSFETHDGNFDVVNSDVNKRRKMSWWKLKQKEITVRKKVRM